MEILLEVRQTGDKIALEWANEQIWNEVAGFVKTMIGRYGELGNIHYSDLINESAIAIFSNIDNYNPEKGTISTYLTPHIVHVLSEYITKEMNKTSAYYSGNIRKVEKAINYFAGKNITPTTVDICSYTGLSITKVEDALIGINAKNFVSIDDDDFQSPAANCGNPLDDIILLDKKETLQKSLMELPELDRKILITKFDLNEEYEKEQSVSSVAEKLGIQPDKIRRSIIRSLRKLSSNPALFDYYGSSPKQNTCEQNELYTRSAITETFFDEMEDFEEEFMDSLDYFEEDNSIHSNNTNEDIKWNK